MPEMGRKGDGMRGEIQSAEGCLALGGALLLALLAVGPTGAAQSAPPPPPPSASAPETPRLPPLAFAKGTVIPSVTWPGAPGQSYALYLPSGYTPDRTWPVLYAFDPRAKGAAVAELFRAGAERYGYVVASSNTSASDRPDDPNPAALSAMWTDTHARFAIDDRRIYLAGMSGTVRAAVELAHAAPGVVAGVIGAAAGWPFERRPDQGDRFAFYGTTAFGDYNYYEVLGLEEPLRRLGLLHHFEIFEGVHQWMPGEIASRALAWFELQAMKAGLRAKEAGWIDTQWEEALARARAFEASGNLFLAEREYAQAGADFAGLRDTASATAKAGEISRSPAYRKGAERRQEIEKAEKAYLESAPGILAAVNPVSGPVTPAQIVAALKVAELRKKAEKKADFDESWSARRLLAALLGQTSFYLPADFMAKKEYDRAIRVLSVAIEIDEDNPYPWVQRATAHARKGDRKRALADLARAADLGWNDAAQIEAEEAFSILRGEGRGEGRGDGEFQRILARMRQAAGKPGS